MDDLIRLSLSYRGGRSESNELDLYDAAQDLIGFQRSMALTTHLVLNGEIITQAPNLRGAIITSKAPVAGSWEVSAIIAISGAVIYKLGTAPKDTPIGHIVRSAYDYVIAELCGFHVDYNKTLGQQYNELKKSKSNTTPVLERSKFDSLIEKCESAVEFMHRPMVKSLTAGSAAIVDTSDYDLGLFDFHLDRETFQNIRFEITSTGTDPWQGSVSSFNMNTFKGRVFISDEQRPIPFEISSETRDRRSLRKIAESLSLNIQYPDNYNSHISFDAFARRSRSGRLKNLVITNIY